MLRMMVMINTAVVVDDGDYNHNDNCDDNNYDNDDVSYKLYILTR